MISRWLRLSATVPLFSKKDTKEIQLKYFEIMALK